MLVYCKNAWTLKCSSQGKPAALTFHEHLGVTLLVRMQIKCALTVRRFAIICIAVCIAESCIQPMAAIVVLGFYTFLVR